MRKRLVDFGAVLTRFEVFPLPPAGGSAKSLSRAAHSGILINPLQ